MQEVEGRIERTSSKKDEHWEKNQRPESQPVQTEMNGYSRVERKDRTDHTARHSARISQDELE